MKEKDPECAKEVLKVSNYVGPCQSIKDGSQIYDRDPAVLAEYNKTAGAKISIITSQDENFECLQKIYNHDAGAIKEIDNILNGYTWSNWILGTNYRVSPEQCQGILDSNEKIKSAARDFVKKALSHPNEYRTYTDQISDQATKSLIRDRLSNHAAIFNLEESIAK